MGKKTKALLLALCAVALVVTTVFSTMAYLTSNDSVTNTFTVGKVAITLDEADVTNNTSSRVKENAYHLLPGSTYTKDPTVHVAANSEDSWIFVQVTNEITNIEADPTIAAQIEAKGWTALTGVDGVYYKEYTKQDTVKDLVVFENFTIKDDVDNDTLALYNEKTVVVKAYAIQKAGFETDAAKAWAEVSKPATASK